jgi:hypothetical protein
MSYQVLQKYIVNQITNADSNATAAKFRHHQTALNNLIKYNIADYDSIVLSLTSDLEDALFKYKEALIDSNKSDVRGPLTRVRRLSELYIQLTNNDYSKQDFSEIIKNALQKMYGEKLYTGTILASERHAICAKYITYREIAKNIIIKSKSIDPNIWSIVSDDLSVKYPKGLDAAANKLKSFLSGEEIPSGRYPIERISFVAKELGIPPNALGEKLTELHKAVPKGWKVNNSKKNIVKKKKDDSEKKVRYVLNKNLSNHHAEYRDFKINETQPKLLNVSESMIKNTRKKSRIKVVEKKFKPWTFNGRGACASSISYQRSLNAFLAYCCDIENIPYEMVSTRHLTDPEIMGRYIIYKSKTSGSSSAKKLLDTIKLCCEKKGFLYFTADRGERSFDDFFDDLEEIIEEIDPWMNKCNKSTKKNNSFDQGKKNIVFLLKIPAEERKDICHHVSKFLMDKALYFHERALMYFDKAKNAKSISLKNTNASAARQCIDDAYLPAITSLIFETCFTNSPRVINYTTFKFYESASDRYDAYPSITYLRKLGRFEMKAPLYGPTMLDPNSINRHLKNSDHLEAVPIDLILPEDLSGIYKKFLAIRADYIKIQITDQIPTMIDKTKVGIDKIINSSQCDLKPIELNELNKDLEFLQNFTISDIDMFIPYKSRQYNRFSGEEAFNENIALNRAHKRAFYMNQNILAEYFKDCTGAAFNECYPDLITGGVNVHALRHLAVGTHLELNPKNYIGAAAILNDGVEQIIKTYGPKNRAQAMKDLGNM